MFSFSHCTSSGRSISRTASSKLLLAFAETDGCTMPGKLHLRERRYLSLRDRLDLRLGLGRCGGPRRPRFWSSRFYGELHGLFLRGVRRLWRGNGLRLFRMRRFLPLRLLLLRRERGGRLACLLHRLEQGLFVVGFVFFRQLRLADEVVLENLVEQAWQRGRSARRVFALNGVRKLFADIGPALYIEVLEIDLLRAREFAGFHHSNGRAGEAACECGNGCRLLLAVLAGGATGILAFVNGAFVSLMGGRCGRFPAGPRNERNRPPVGNGNLHVFRPVPDLRLLRRLAGLASRSLRLSRRWRRGKLASRPGRTGALRHGRPLHIGPRRRCALCAPCGCRL